MDGIGRSPRPVQLLDVHARRCRPLISAHSNCQFCKSRSNFYLRIHQLSAGPGTTVTPAYTVLSLPAVMSYLIVLHQYPRAR